MRFRHLLLMGLIVFTLSGCYRYACPAPAGVSCKPISEVYRQSLNGGLSNSKTFGNGTPRGSKGTKRVSYKHDGEKNQNFPQSGRGEEIDEEIKVQGPVVLPVKIYKYIDSEGDLHRPGYIFVVIKRENWSGLEEEEVKPLYPKTPVKDLAGKKEESNETGLSDLKQPGPPNTGNPPGNLPNPATGSKGLPANFQTDFTGRVK